MIRTRLLRVPAAIALAFLTGCGERGGATGAASGGGAAGGAAAVVADDLGRLVPADAMGILYIESISALETKARSLVGAVDPDAAREVDVAKMLEQVAGPAMAQVDRSRAMAVAFSPGPGKSQAPSPTMILPVRDGAAALAAFGDIPPGRPRPVVLGGYLALSQSPTHAAASASSALVRGLPVGDLVLRIDLGRAVSVYRRQIDEALGQVAEKAGGRGEEPGPSAGRAGEAKAVFEGLAKAFRTFVDSAETLDLAVRLEGSSVANLDLAFTARAGSALDRTRSSAGDMAAVAACLPKDYPIEMGLGIPMKDIWDWVESMSDSILASMPEARRASLRSSLGMSKEFYGLLGDAMAMGMRFGPQGIEGVAVMTTKDPKVYSAKRDEMMKTYSAEALAEMGGSIEASPAVTVDGVEVRGWTMKYDWAKAMESQGTGANLDPRSLKRMSEAMDSVFGKDGLRIREAIVGDRILSVVGGADDLMAQAIAAAKAKGGKPPPALARALARAGERPAFVLAVDLREAISGMMDMVTKMMPEESGKGVPQLPAGGPVPIVVFGSAKGREYRGGLSVDVGAAAQLVKAIVEQIRPRTKPFPEEPVPSPDDK